jgi:hypothetical protein
MKFPHAIRIVVEVVEVVDVVALVGVVVVEVLVVGAGRLTAVVVVVVVLSEAQPLAVQASQQLGTVPTQAPPCFGLVHRAALDLIAHDVLPLLVVRQQVTKPGLPQVDLAAHFATARAQLRFVTAVFASRATHFTYSPWLVAVAQSQRAATAVRAAAMSVRSGSVDGSQPALASRAPRASTAMSVNDRDRTMREPSPFAASAAGTGPLPSPAAAMHGGSADAPAVAGRRRQSSRPTAVFDCPRALTRRSCPH